MISVEIAKESRARDKKRARVALKIGRRSWRLTAEEALALSSDLFKAVTRRSVVFVPIMCSIPLPKGRA